jgi:hypothetical protein
LYANRSTPSSENSGNPTDSTEQKFQITIGLKDLPVTGIQQGVLTLNFTTPDGPRILTVPLSFVWL